MRHFIDICTYQHVSYVSYSCSLAAVKRFLNSLAKSKGVTSRLCFSPILNLSPPAILTMNRSALINLGLLLVLLLSSSVLGGCSSRQICCGYKPRCVSSGWVSIAIVE